MTDYVNALVGGVLLGAAAVFLRFVLASPLGISGILSKALSFRLAVADWRLSFLVGMLAVGFALPWLFPAALAETLTRDTWLVVIAALLVGSGARIAGGCTSGHSLCGMGSLHIDSLVATAIFILTGAIAVALTTGGVAG